MEPVGAAAGDQHGHANNPKKGPSLLLASRRDENHPKARSPQAHPDVVVARRCYSR